MFRKISIIVAFVFLALTLLGPSASAYTLDPETGNGFVGKGEVQVVYGWNDNALQRNAESVEFRLNSELVTEVTWTCTNSNNENLQERERTTTTSTEGLVDSIGRMNNNANKITGFNLLGFDGDKTETTATEGNPLNSCPSGPWTLTTPAGDPEVVSSTGGLQVSIDGSTWITLQ